MSWIVVPNWPKFQHYKDRDPVWIKLYTDLQSKDEWRDLSLSARGLLVCIWLEYARSHEHLKVSGLTARVQGSRIRRSLDSLQAAGFIEIAASPRARAREVEKEKERSSELRKPRRSKNAGDQPELLTYPEWQATLKQRAAF